MSYMGANMKKGTRIKKERPRLFDVFSKNFNAALDKESYPSLHYGRQTEVARVFQISTSAARKWVMGECIPDWDNLLFIADTLNVSVDALLGRTVKLESTPATPGPIAGGHTPIDETGLTKLLGGLQFDANWLETGMRLKHEGLQLMIASGNSMSPTLDDGDIIFVDTRATLIENNAIYLFKCNDGFLIRRVQLTPEGSVELVCDNKKIANTIVPRSAIHTEQIEAGFDARESDLLIVGKVQWTIKRASMREKQIQSD